jgi:hypothetical protein
MSIMLSALSWFSVHLLLLAAGAAVVIALDPRDSK